MEACSQVAHPPSSTTVLEWTQKQREARTRALSKVQTFNKGRGLKQKISTSVAQGKTLYNRPTKRTRPGAEGGTTGARKPGVDAGYPSQPEWVLCRQPWNSGFPTEKELGQAELEGQDMHVNFDSVSGCRAPRTTGLAEGSVLNSAQGFADSFRRSKPNGAAELQQGANQGSEELDGDWRRRSSLAKFPCQFADSAKGCRSLRGSLVDVRLPGEVARQENAQVARRGVKP